jgi:hypothetical protein
MKSFKKIGLALLITGSMGAFSTAALAESDPGRISYAPVDAINLVLKEIQVSSDALKAGSPGDTVAPLIKNASDASKEINANDRVDRQRVKANDVLKAARKAAKEGNNAEAAKLLEDAAKQFEALKALI